MSILMMNTAGGKPQFKTEFKRSFYVFENASYATRQRTDSTDWNGGYFCVPYLDSFHSSSSYLKFIKGLDFYNNSSDASGDPEFSLRFSFTNRNDIEDYHIYDKYVIHIMYYTQLKAVIDLYDLEIMEKVDSIETNPFHLFGGGRLATYIDKTTGEFLVTGNDGWETSKINIFKINTVTGKIDTVHYSTVPYEKGDAVGLGNGRVVYQRGSYDSSASMLELEFYDYVNGVIDNTIILSSDTLRLTYNISGLTLFKKFIVTPDYFIFADSAAHGPYFQTDDNEGCVLIVRNSDKSIVDFLSSPAPSSLNRFDRFGGGIALMADGQHIVATSKQKSGSFYVIDLSNGAIVGSKTDCLIEAPTGFTDAVIVGDYLYTNDTEESYKRKFDLSASGYPLIQRMCMGHCRRVIPNDPEADAGVLRLRPLGDTGDDCAVYMSSMETVFDIGYENTGTIMEGSTDNYQVEDLNFFAGNPNQLTKNGDLFGYDFVINHINGRYVAGAPGDQSVTTTAFDPDLNSQHAPVTFSEPSTMYGRAIYFGSGFLLVGSDDKIYIYSQFNTAGDSGQIASVNYPEGSDLLWGNEKGSSFYTSCGRTPRGGLNPDDWQSFYWGHFYSDGCCPTHDQYGAKICGIPDWVGFAWYDGDYRIVSNFNAELYLSNFVIRYLTELKGRVVRCSYMQGQGGEPFSGDDPKLFVVMEDNPREVMVFSTLTGGLLDEACITVEWDIGKISATSDFVAVADTYGIDLFKIL